DHHIGQSISPTWVYMIDVSKFDISNLHDVITRFGNLTETINDKVAFSFLKGFKLTGGLFTANNALQFYDNQAISLQIPTYFMIIEFIGLTVYFVSLMVDLLLERETETIATLRSRGFSRQQIYRSLAWQYLGLAFVGFLVGLALAIPVAWTIGKLF